MARITLDVNKKILPRFLWTLHRQLITTVPISAKKKLPRNYNNNKKSNFQEISYTLNGIYNMFDYAKQANYHPDNNTATPVSIDAPVFITSNNLMPFSYAYLK